MARCWSGSQIHRSATTPRVSEFWSLTKLEQNKQSPRQLRCERAKRKRVMERGGREGTNDKVIEERREKKEKLEMEKRKSFVKVWYSVDKLCLCLV